MAETLPLLHLYPGAFWHDTAYIVGNRQGLELLRGLIDDALIGQESRRAAFSGRHDSAFTSDGEGYQAFVIRQDTPWTEQPWARLKLPYTDEICPQQPGDTEPVGLLTADEIKRALES